MFPFSSLYAADLPTHEAHNDFTFPAIESRPKQHHFTAPRQAPRPYKSSARAQRCATLNKPQLTIHIIHRHQHQHTTTAAAGERVQQHLRDTMATREELIQSLQNQHKLALETVEAKYKQIEARDKQIEAKNKQILILERENKLLTDQLAAAATAEQVEPEESEDEGSSHHNNEPSERKKRKRRLKSGKAKRGGAASSAAREQRREANRQAGGEGEVECGEARLTGSHQLLDRMV